MRFVVLTVLILFCVLFPSSAQPPTDYDALFGEYEGTFVMYDLNQDIMTIYNPERASERYPPFSTYKVPHTAIALEAGIASDETFSIEYNGSQYPYTGDLQRFYTPSQWASDHDLQSAVQLSIVWYFQEIATLIEQDTMQAYLDQFDYGNRDLSSWLGDDLLGNGRPFWLGGSLEISAIEQVLWWQALYQGELGLSEATTDTVLDIITLYQTDDYRLYGKTGTRAGDLGLAWFVGIIEQEDDVFVFAFNVEGSPAVRSQLLRAILVGQGYMPADNPLFQQ